MKIPVEFFPTFLGSMSSPDGQTFMLRVKREDGSDLLLGFPHREIPNIVECAAMQMVHGRDEVGGKVVTAFNTSSFQLGRGPNGKTVLSMVVGETGKISFLLPHEMREQLIAMLARAETRH